MEHVAAGLAGIGGCAQRSGRIAGEIGALVADEGSDLQRRARTEVVEPRQRAEEIALVLGGVGAVGDEVGRRVAVLIVCPHRAGRGRRERQQRRIERDLIVALGVADQQPEVIGFVQAIVGAHEGAPAPQAIVEDRARGRRVEAALGGPEAAGGHDGQRSEPAGAEGLPFDRVVGAVSEQQLSLGPRARAAGLDVDHPGSALELGGQAAHDDVGALDDLAAEQLLQPILHRRRQGDVVDAQGEPGEAPADVDGAVVVADDSRLGGDDVVERAGRPAWQRLDLLGRHRAGAGAVSSWQRRGRINEGHVRRVAVRVLGARLEAEHQIADRRGELKGVAKRVEAVGAHIQQIGAGRHRRDAEAPGAIGVGRLDGGVALPCLDPEEHQLRLGQRRAPAADDLTFDLEGLDGWGRGDGCRGGRPERKSDEQPGGDGKRHAMKSTQARDWVKQEETKKRQSRDEQATPRSLCRRRGVSRSIRPRPSAAGVRPAGRRSCAARRSPARRLG